MKTFLILYILFFLGTQTAKAESVWLILSMESYAGGIALEKIEMKNMAQCEEEGLAYKNSKRVTKWKNKNRGFECLKGK